MSKHTPGPWWVKKDWSDDSIEHQRQLFSVESSDGSLEIKLEGTYWGKDAVDAALIAAAPDLLQALQNWEFELSRRYGELHPGVVEVRAAIAKATKSPD